MSDAATTPAGTPSILPRCHQHPGMPGIPGTPDQIPVLHPPSTLQGEQSKTVYDGSDFDGFNPSFDIDGAAERVLRKYDANRDGLIDVDSETRTPRGPGGSIFGDSYDSIKTLAAYADAAGNGNGMVTVDEIVAVMNKYDKDGQYGFGDGRLNRQERDSFLTAFREDVEYPGPPMTAEPYSGLIERAAPAGD